MVKESRNKNSTTFVKKQNMLNIGLFGVGHLGKIHAKLIIELKDKFNFIGFFDPCDTNAQIAIDTHNLKRYSTIDELLAEVDCIDIVTPTISHFEIASKALRLSKHVFIEKPITQTNDEAKKLVKLANEAGVTVQVGHVERFNPAFKAALPAN